MDSLNGLYLGRGLSVNKLVAGGPLSNKANCSQNQLKHILFEEPLPRCPATCVVLDAIIATMPGLGESRWARKTATRTSFLHSPGKYCDSSRLPSPSRHELIADLVVCSLPPLTSETATRSDAPAALDPRHELDRYTRLVRRLKWKLQFLVQGYDRATARSVNPLLAAEAELMFKLDFFEYYMLLERALVHLLGVFGTTVSRDFSEQHLQALAEGGPLGRRGMNGSTPGGFGRDGAGGGPDKTPPAQSPAATAPVFAHRYHANVLEALDNAENPLHEILGTGEVRRQLGRAKDLRNRWKHVDDDEPAAASKAGAPFHRTYLPAPLESYDLEKILNAIFDGFDRAFIKAECFVVGVKDVNMAVAEDVDQDDPWMFIVDAMDWEAL